jgi:RNA methyltransferase, TrmH family
MGMARPAGSQATDTEQGKAGVITSRENRWLKRFRGALSGMHGDDGSVGVEGVRLVEAALGSNLTVDAVLVSASGARHLPRISPRVADGVPVLRTSDKLFSSVADTQAPQGIAALVRPRQVSIEELSRSSDTVLLVALVGVQDPGNVGTIVRAAEAFGATGAAACAADGTGTADPFSPKALRSSAGSVLRLPIARGVSAAALLVQLQRAGIKVYAAVAVPSGHGIKNQSLENASPACLPWEIDWKTSAAILIGNEGSGLPDAIVSAADARVFIPQAAASAPVGIESLNAAMAASVLLYEAMRQRSGGRRVKS